jgi:LysR family glycine cleavage system transcriptional activator
MSISASRRGGCDRRPDLIDPDDPAAGDARALAAKDDRGDAGRRQRLPSLRALRTFEVVGRYLNMQSAADELCITVSAVSHQIRSLETELGTELFRRTGRTLELTKQGAALLPGLVLVFDQLGSTINQFRRHASPDIVTISMSPEFAMRWFIPRLSKFQERFPSIDIRVATHVGREVQRDTSVDCYIHVGGPDWPDFRGELLFKERLGIACSPTLLQKPGLGVAAASDVLKHRLLRSNDRPEDWSLWLAGSALTPPLNQRTLSFGSRNLAIQAAIEGLGMVLADTLEISEELHAGRLVLPLDATASIAVRGHYFISVGEGEPSGPVPCVRDWLRGEVGVKETE